MTENESVNDGVATRYVKWLLKGNVLFVVLKLAWNGMILSSLLLFRLKTAAAIIGVGVVIWFLWNDKENWYIDI